MIRASSSRFFFIARRAGKVTTLSPARFCSWPGVEEKQLWWPVCALFCQRSSRNVVDDKGVFIANFFRGGRLGKTIFASILDIFPVGWVPFCTSWAAWAPRWVRPSILGRFWDAPGVALGGLGVPLGSLGAPSRAPSGRKSGKNAELCERYVAKAGRVMKTGSPDPPNVVKT